MNTLKRHLALIIPLLALLFSLQSILLINRAIHTKEDKLLQNYSILLASKTPLDLATIQNSIRNATSLNEIDSTFLLQRFEDVNSPQDIENLKKELPFFYSLKLNFFPSQKDLDAIEKNLKAMDSIVQIETFSKTHNQVYKLLYFIKKNILIFAALLAIFSLLLMMRQIQVWRYQHQKRMQIMDLLGASFWLKNGILFKVALTDSIISSLAISLGGFYLSLQPKTQDIFLSLEIQNNVFNFGQDFLLLLCVSILVSLFSVCFVILFQKRS